MVKNFINTNPVKKQKLESNGAVRGKDMSFPNILQSMTACNLKLTEQKQIVYKNNH